MAKYKLELTAEQLKELLIELTDVLEFYEETTDEENPASDSALRLLKYIVSNIKPNK